MEEVGKRKCDYILIVLLRAKKLNYTICGWVTAFQLHPVAAKYGFWTNLHISE